MSPRIVQIIDNLGIGGAEKLLVLHAKQAYAYSFGMTVVVLAADFDQTIFDELKKNGVNTVLFPAKHLFSLNRILHLARFLRQGNFDLVCCHLTASNIIGALCGHLAGLPIVTTLHSTRRGSRRFSSVFEVLEIWSMRLFSKRIVAVAYSIADIYQARLRGAPIDVIPNAVSVPEEISNFERTRLRQEITGDAARPIVVSVGRLAPPKGYEDLITAFSLLSSTHPKALLIIVGDGRLFEKVRAQITEMDLEKNVMLLGMRQDVPRLLAASDLYVSSSHREGLPLTILEAMMAGLPVVATSVGDVPRLISPEIGLVVPPHQPESIAKAIAKLLDEPARLRQMGAAGRALAVEQYSPQAWMERLFNLYRQLLPEKAGEFESERLVH